MRSAENAVGPPAAGGRRSKLVAAKPPSGSATTALKPHRFRRDRAPDPGDGRPRAVHVQLEHFHRLAHAVVDGVERVHRRRPAFKYRPCVGTAAPPRPKRTGAGVVGLAVEPRGRRGARKEPRGRGLPRIEQVQAAVGPIGGRDDPAGAGHRDQILRGRTGRTRNGCRRPARTTAAWTARAFARRGRRPHLPRSTRGVSAKVLMVRVPSVRVRPGRGPHAAFGKPAYRFAIGIRTRTVRRT